MLLCLGVFCVLGAYPLVMQFTGPGHLTGPVQIGAAMPLPLSDLIEPDRLLAFAPGATNTSPLHDGYIGLPLLVGLVALTWRLRRSSRVVVAAFAGLLVLVLALGQSLLLVRQGSVILPLPWRLLGRLPLFDNAIPERMTVLLFLAIAVIVAEAVERFPALTGRRRLAGVVSAGIALLPLTPTPSFPTVARAAPRFFTGSAVERITPGTVAYVEPLTDLYAPVYWQAVSGMRFRQHTGAEFVRGDSGSQFGPRTNALDARIVATELGATVPPMTPDMRSQALAGLSELSVRTVVLGPLDGSSSDGVGLDESDPALLEATRRELRLVGYWTELLGRAPERVDGVYVWFDCCKPAGSTAPGYSLHRLGPSGEQ
jgi:hypothetical protein